MSQTSNRKKRPAIPKITMVRARLQQEISSICPFCQSTDVAHFQIHHIDSNPSNNEYANLLLLCPTCHSKVTKEEIGYEDVKEKKGDLQIYSQPNLRKPIIKYDSPEIFQTEFTAFINDKNSLYYQEIKQNSNWRGLLEDAVLLSEIINHNLTKSIDYGILALISDIVKSHLSYDRDAKYMYYQKHIYKHLNDNEGYDMPIYYHIKFVGLLYFNAIESRIDIAMLSKKRSHMLSIFAGMIEEMLSNLDSDGVDRAKEYPTNYHWLISEIFDIMHEWLDEFNKAEYFDATSSYVEFIPYCINLCLSELYKAEAEGIISRKFLISCIYSGVISFYFNNPLNEKIRKSIDENIINKIPDELLEPIFAFSLDEAFAIRFDEFWRDDFHKSGNWKREGLSHLRSFLIAKNKI